MKAVSKLNVLLLLGAVLQAPAFAASEAEQIGKIQSLPIERCQKDLTKLHDIHGQMRYMTQEQGVNFLALIGQDLKSQGVEMPPPPPPCSAVHLALEQRCGDVSDAKNKCSVALVN